MGKNEAKKYRYLRLPLATPEEAAERRQYLIQIDTIRPAAEAYSCGHGAVVNAPYCPECGQGTVVWR